MTSALQALPAPASDARSDSPRMRAGTALARMELIEQATAYVDVRLAEDLRLDECARSLYTSPRQLQRALADHGTSWRRLVLDARMRRAAERLAEGHWTIRRIARSVGYSEPGQFAKAFRRSQGITPSDYRDRARDTGGDLSGDAAADGDLSADAAAAAVVSTRQLSEPDSGV